MVGLESGTSRSRPTANEMLRVAMPARQRKRPRQTRSIALVEALKSAGWEILQKDGRQGLTVQRLAQRSGVAPSSIYEYFPAVDALIEVIFEDYRSRVRRELLEDILSLPPPARLYDAILLVLRRAFAALHEWSLIDPELCTRSARHDELVRLDLVKADRFWEAFVVQALLERFPGETGGREKKMTAYLAHQIILALPRALLLDKPDYLADPDAPIVMARMLHAVLSVEPS